MLSKDIIDFVNNGERMSDQAVSMSHRKIETLALSSNRSTRICGGLMLLEFGDRYVCTIVSLSHTPGEFGVQFLKSFEGSKNYSKLSNASDGWHSNSWWFAYRCLGPLLCGKLSIETSRPCKFILALSKWHQGQSAMNGEHSCRKHENGPTFSQKGPLKRPWQKWKSW